eukprot:4449919-Prymnesium_polylepis.1
MDFRGRDWILMGSKTNPMDLTSSSELSKLSSGWTIMAWLKYDHLDEAMQVEFLVCESNRPVSPTHHPDVSAL